MDPLGWIVGLIFRILSKLGRSNQEKDQNLYGLDHAILHVEIPPSSMWMNLGYWKDETNFPDACRALLDQVLIDAGLLGENGQPIHIHRPAPQTLKLVDVGFGCGDQSMDLTRRVSRTGAVDSPEEAPGSRPLFDSYVGITIARAQADFARHRLLQNAVSKAAQREGTATPTVELFCADAADPGAWSPELQRAVLSERASSSISSNDETTHVYVHARMWLLALDTLYHFKPSRSPLFQYAYSDMQASIMAFDLLLSDSASLWNKLLLRIICFVTGTPFSNFVTAAQYEEMLIRAGYSRELIRMRDISEHVFPGIAGFIVRKDEELKRFGMSVGKFKGAGKVFGWWARSGVVRGVVVVARRSDLF